MTIEEIVAALKAIVETAGAEPLTDEQAQRYEELEKTLATLQRDQQIRARQNAYQTPAPGLNVGTATSKPDDTLERAFEHFMRTGVVNQDITELRAQGEATGTEGGYLVPDGFRQKMVDRMKAFGGIANHVEQISTDSGNPLPWPTIDDTANVGEIVEEGGTFTSGADLVFGSASLGAYKYMAGGGSSTPLRVSVELAQDSAFDLQGLISSKLGMRVARIQATHLISGTGVNQPQGITTGLTGIEIAADGSGITYDDLVTFIHSVDPEYRDGAMWAFNDATLARLEKIKDSHGDSIWRPFSSTMGTGAQGDAGKVGQTGTLLGYPYQVDQGFPDVVVASNTVNWGVFGNLREGYVQRKVKDFTLVVNPWTRASYGQIEYTAWARMDAVQQNTNAYVALTGEQ